MQYLPKWVGTELKHKPPVEFDVLLNVSIFSMFNCSSLMHGSEAWTLTPRALAMLNGFNSRQLHRITGRSYREEATKPSYDLLTAVRRYQWLGHILRMPADRLVRHVACSVGAGQTSCATLGSDPTDLAAY